MAYQIEHTRGTPPVTPLYTPDLDNMIAWLETQDPTRRYNWFDVNDCLLCNFAVACGGQRHDWECIADIHDDNLRVAAFMAPWTYGHALERARMLKRTAPRG